MTTSTDAGGWQALGPLLIQRRTALDPRFHNRNAFAEAKGLSYRLVYDIEDGRRTNFGKSTLAAIEMAYELEPAAILRFINGGDLLLPEDGGVTLPLPDMTKAFQDAFEAERGAVAAWVAAAEKRKRRFFRELRGSDIFPLSRPDQLGWDAAVIRQLSRKSILDLIAFARVLEQQDVAVEAGDGLA